MKRIGRYITLIAAIAVVVVMVAKILSNKKQTDTELKTMLAYSAIVPVEIVVPTTLQAKQILEENGTLRSGAEISVLSETSGRVTSVVGNVGDRVAAGQTLVTVEKEVLKSQFQLAKAILENANKDMNRFVRLAEGDAITAQQLEASKLSYQNARTSLTAIRKQLKNTVIKSPDNGVISERSVEKGDFLVPSKHVFTIQKQNQMIFAVRIADTELFRIHNGQQVKITINGSSHEPFTGNIKSIGVVPDLSGRYEVEVSVANTGNELRAGMTGRAVFQSEMQEAGLVIPRKCIVGSINDASVYVLTGDSVRSENIKVLPIDETSVLVTDGLTINEKIVRSGQMNLQNGSKVKVINGRGQQL
ncbi:MAG: efflux RND transporter periplasmic adaptor subunit [Deltaproteobacteria bacterium]|nr:efflux RND transporter periplasmic adaptor subunit [Deltaproteobacteria bacterium]